MKVLFIGGTGLISSAATKLAVEQGIDLYLLTRGKRDASVPKKATMIHVDINNREEMKALLKDKHFDVVVNWINFSPKDIERDIAYFSRKTNQYIFISTVATYQSPPAFYKLDESTPPQNNPVWDYAINKIASEERLMKEYRDHSFPITIVRPSHTYGDTTIPFAVSSGAHPWTLVDRIEKGKKIIVPGGDGTSLWTITHNSDFAKGLVGLFGNMQTIGHAFHITSDEVKTWNQYLDVIGDAVGVEPKPIHMTTECISLFMPAFKGPLYGDASNSFVVDNHKIKTFVPTYMATTNFETGIRQSINYFRNNPELQTVDEQLNEKMDFAIDSYETFLASIK
ncbi:NAD-dependent epimerase/dehydratase [Gracilibacillus boraciitolerans JCM 21714]|uniref:NAD-dependent epimerase/dehydratase n=1 Tax=Gracilibacillus boraciitolerans JCM 21714 TaxID=1298598 RepID=W4VNS4_9BACI|nr:NAD-dependent epimerase/dehydratase family protein [Gracilibacillus boraciitolerans]GAE94821.1 NAD-dependent epimerase/dehydratase [Gracilibacillus boraciitolerans JCM 21714]